MDVWWRSEIEDINLDNTKNLGFATLRNTAEFPLHTHAPDTWMVWDSEPFGSQTPLAFVVGPFPPLWA